MLLFEGGKLDIRLALDELSEGILFGDYFLTDMTLALLKKGSSVSLPLMIGAGSVSLKLLIGEQCQSRAA